MTDHAVPPAEHSASPRWLEEFRQQVQEGRHRWRGREVLWSWARLATFIAFFAIWIVWADQLAVALPGMAVSAALFALSIRRHRLAEETRELADHAVQIIHETGLRTGGHVTLIRSGERPPPPSDPAAALVPLIEDGPVWPLTDQERGDLDLFSPPVGLFGLLNRTSSIIGARRLADMLDRPLLSAEQLQNRQEAIATLDLAPGDRLTIMAATIALRGQDAELERLIRATREVRPPGSPAVMLALRLWSVPSVSLSLYMVGRIFFSAEFHWALTLLGLLSINWLLGARLRQPVGDMLKAWRHLAPAANAYLRVARRAPARLSAEGQLGTVRRTFEKALDPAALPKLCSMLPWNDAAGMMRSLLNAAAFYDVHVACGIARTAVPHRETLLEGLSAVAELEALCSLAAFAWETRTGTDVCYPVPVEEPVLRITDGRHPLIPPDLAVPNTLHLDTGTRMWIITGSNMAGKSTFLRMAGVNVLLAQMGTVAVARDMCWRPLRLVTDLRARDDLARSESYFLAEVRQLRRMLAEAPGGTTLFGLIDEPFRGTNSDERHAASVSVIEHLQRSDHFFLIATHERLLTELADGQDTSNYHFREALESGVMVFDYHLRPGPAQTRNALHVLEQEGYPEEITRTAREWLARMQDAAPLRNGDP